MEPVGCILSVSPPVCIFRRGSMAGIPFFHHVGANSTYPTPCNCTKYRTPIQANPLHDCNAFKFIAGFLYWNLGAATGVNELLALMSIKQIHEASFRAAWISSTYGRVSPLKGLFNAAYRQQAFAFCTLPGIGPCNMATFSIYDTTPGVFTISADYMQLTFGACRDSVTPDPSAWEKLVVTPYANLNQQYEECRYSSAEVFQNQAGITIGEFSSFQYAF